MADPFLSQTPFVSPSLNRLPVAALPGDHFPETLRGKIGYLLLSAGALRAMINTRSAELGVTAGSSDLLYKFDSCFSAPSAAVRAAAQQIATAYGHRLALLLITLKQALPANRQALPSWNQAHWEFWKRITTVHVGGGLMAGAVGPLSISSAVAALRRCDCDELDVHLSPFGANLPLAGLARTAPAEAQTMLVLDFGHTDVKRAVVAFRLGSHSTLHLLSNIPAPVEPEPPPAFTTKYAQEVADQIVETVAQSWQEARVQDWPLSSIIGLSLACYLVGGHPPPSEMGHYGRLQLLTDHLQTYLTQRISKAIGQRVQINLFHDGTAAALAFYGSQNTAVIMLGTAIGVGFPPDTDQGLREVPLHIFPY